MELLSPAGNVEKLYYAYAYGADAAYIGLKKFSLRVKADNFYGCEYKNVCALKDAFPGKKLFCALNISFHNRDIDAFIADIDYFKQYPIDAFIVQDMGIVPILQKYFPDTALHLSTQANCINREAVKLYHSMGFKRIVLGREASLAEIREIKDAVPDIELEVFVHGAMCIAYSGRCLMSAYMNGRSANGGFCSHSCRWDYILKADAGTLKNLAESGALVLEERKRPGEYLPVFEGDDFTAVLSSKDLCMIDHLADMRAAGVDSLKIEGRMKSVYYVALVTRAYRKALDALDGTISQRDADPFIAELDKVSHRAFGTGFYYGQSDANETVKGASESEYELAAKIGAELTENEIQQVYAAGDRTKLLRDQELSQMHPAAREAKEKDYALHPEKCPACITARAGWRMYHFEALNKICAGVSLECVAPDIVSIAIPADRYVFIDPESGTCMDWVCHGHSCILMTAEPIAQGQLVRVRVSDL